MFDFDYEEKTAEQREKELFEKTSKKQNKIVKRILTGVFCGLGGMYLAIGIVALIISEDLETSIVGYVFGGIGLLFVIVGIILFFAIPNTGNYDRYKKTVNTFGYTNSFSLNAKVQMLTEENNELKERLESLEKKIRELEDK